jgi:excisionase family DNA binding protein
MRNQDVADAGGGQAACTLLQGPCSDFLTAEAAASILGITVRRVYGLKKKGWPFFRCGRELRIRREKFWQHVEKQEKAIAR